MPLDPPFASISLDLPANTEEWLRRFHLWLDFRPRLYETDANGHMSQLTYFGWQEWASFQYWANLGYDTYFASMDTVSLFMGEQYCRFLAEVQFNDAIRLGVRVARLGTSSAGLEYAFVRPDGALAAIGVNSQVLVEVSTRRPVPLPDDLRQAVLRFEESPAS
ncbi:MAG TPA: thioesterase family protein [Chloroflexota bacterium]|nr:thioesterase family protein [Chloroflexota bacterium]